MGKPENTTSLNDTPCTPESIWGPIVRALGPIGLDPAAHPSSTVPAAFQIYLPEYCTDPDPRVGEVRSGGEFEYVYGDGLKYDWGGCGLTFLNGPYSQLPDVKARPSWWNKFLTEVDEGVHFFPVRTACDWWQTYVPQLTVLTFLRHRVKHDNVFWPKDSKDGKHKAGDPIEDGAAFSQALGYVGPRAELWLPEARKLGHTIMLGGNPRFHTPLSAERLREIQDLTHEWGSDTPGDAYDPSVQALVDLTNELVRLRGER